MEAGETEIEGKRATFLMTHTMLLKFVVMLALVWFANDLYYFLNGC